MILLANGKLITRDGAGTGFYPDGGVVTDGGKIVAVGTTAELKAQYCLLYTSICCKPVIRFYGAAVKTPEGVFGKSRMTAAVSKGGHPWKPKYSWKTKPHPCLLYTSRCV